MPRFKHGRHTPAFVLLFLAEEPAYGLELFNKLEAFLNVNTIDSAAIYRSLKDLEAKGMVNSYWDTTESGPAKKYYSITEKGLKKLDEFNKDIEKRIANLTLFIEKYKSLCPKGEESDE